MWQLGLRARGFSLGLVCLTCVFITLWAGIGGGIHKNNETPTPVRNLTPFFPVNFLTADITWVSIGVGSALSARENALVANTSGCGSRYLLR